MASALHVSTSWLWESRARVLAAEMVDMTALYRSYVIPFQSGVLVEMCVCTTCIRFPV